MPLIYIHILELIPLGSREKLSFLFKLVKLKLLFQRNLYSIKENLAEETVSLI